MSGTTIRVTLLTQDDCTFCNHAKDVLARVAADYPLEVEEIDLGSPAGQALAVGEGVFFAPGVLLDGALFSHGRLSEEKLRRALDAAIVTDRTTPTRRDRIILWTATPAGVVLSLATLLGNYTGRAILPFDQHHFIGQVGGFGLILWGLVHWK
jgi:glutaredoxin